MVSLELEARLDNLLVTAQAETADIDIFAPIQEREECPICMIPLPLDDENIMFVCCGKRICNGCIYTHIRTNGRNGKQKLEEQKCPFCCQSCLIGPLRIKALKKLMKKKNPDAFMQMAKHYKRGECGVIQSDTRVLEMLIEAAELGNAHALAVIGKFYKDGLVVERDISKALNFGEVAAKNGYILANLLASLNDKNGNTDECIQHLVVTASAGDEEAMDILMTKYKQKLLRKEDLTQTLRAYQTSRNEMKSEDRENAARLLKEKNSTIPSTQKFLEI